MRSGARPGEPDPARRSRGERPGCRNPAPTASS
ncbi:phage DNA packaging protein J [Streptomyces sp. NPDC057257]